MKDIFILYICFLIEYNMDIENVDEFDRHIYRFLSEIAITAIN